MHPHDFLYFALLREGATNPQRPTARTQWKRVYRQFRQDAAALYHVEKQLLAFRGFPRQTSVSSAVSCSIP
jgi:hypothetical protein